MTKRMLSIGIQTFRARASIRFRQLLEALHERTGQRVAVLVKERGCADRYRRLGQPIHLVGVEFSRKERNVAGFSVERT